MARSPFLRQTLERHPEQVHALLTSRALSDPTTSDYLHKRWRVSCGCDRRAQLTCRVAPFPQGSAVSHYLARFDALGGSPRDHRRHQYVCRGVYPSRTRLAAPSGVRAIWHALGYRPGIRRRGATIADRYRYGEVGVGANLTYISDIDLIFAFPGKGETRGGRRSLDNQQFFIRLGQRLIQALDQITADGFVFRVDMRLRPYGQSGALALSFAALETYYQDQGRDWERYAMVKSRIVAGDPKAGQVLMESLRPFVYRRYIDFSAFESLRSMKAMISREVRRQGLENNIKLGSGGIREIEFVVQAFQLIRGGRDRELQQRELLIILNELEALELLPSPVVNELREAYIFLRNLEHALQGMEDEPDPAIARRRACERAGRIDHGL